MTMTSGNKLCSEILNQNTNTSVIVWGGKNKISVHGADGNQVLCIQMGTDAVCAVMDGDWMIFHYRAAC